MRILAYEYVSGGGYAGKLIPSSVLCEGFGMLRALTLDLKEAGHQVATMLDSRLVAFNPPLVAECTSVAAFSAEAEAAFDVAAESVDAVYVIAPESKGILESFVARAERAGAASLNCDPAAIYNVANKQTVLEYVRRLGFRVPNSLALNVNDKVEDVARAVGVGLGFPAVFKPTDGVGCSGVSAVNVRSQVESAIDRIRKESSSEVFLAQELVQGVPVSVSVYSTGKDALPVSLNKQNVSLKTPECESSYDGGEVPYDSLLKRKAFNAAKKFVESVRGLRGYIGVDMVLTEEEPVVIEVNPRFTTSYLALRMVSGFNPAQALVDSVLERKLPVDCETMGYGCFEKVKTIKPRKTCLPQTYGLEGVFSPPFPVSNDDSAYALVVSHGNTLQEASLRLERNKRGLLSSLHGKGE